MWGYAIINCNERSVSCQRVYTGVFLDSIILHNKTLKLKPLFPLKYKVVQGHLVTLKQHSLELNRFEGCKLVMF